MADNSHSAPDINPAILLEAADWLVLLQSGDATAKDLADWDLWRERDSEHAAAWMRAQNMLGTLKLVPAKIGRETLLRPARSTRRHLLRVALLLMPVGWAAWRFAPWREWSADLTAGAGERKTLTLADGTHLVLNTRSAVNVAFTAGERRLTLVSGEILITTSHQDPSPVLRPFVVETSNGFMRALGTRFSVRHVPESGGNVTRLAVFEGAVEVRTSASGEVAIARAGEQLHFTVSSLQAAQPVKAGAAFWEHGLLLVRDMRLDALVVELARYQRGVLCCDPAIGGLRVSGAFPVMDVPASLGMLEKSLPVRVNRLSSFWLRLELR